MALFGNPEYQWRETYFVLFKAKQRPTIQAIEKAFEGTQVKYTFVDLQVDENQQLDQVTMLSEYDNSAMDISYIEGEEVAQQIVEIETELRETSQVDLDARKVALLGEATARFDIFHFERLAAGEEDEMLDPGALLVVLDKLTTLCQGVGVDPQSGSLI